MERDRLIEILKNKEMAARLRKCKNPQEAYELLKGSVELSFDEFMEVMTSIKDEFSNEEASLLQESDMQSVLKGCKHSETTATTVTTITASASAADF